MKTAASALDVRAIRAQFPALAQEVHGRPLVYLDNAATMQKPRAVIDAVRRFYEEDCSNVHRGVHQLSERATKSFEGAREIVRRFVNAASEREIVFTRGTTESINLVANCFVRPRLRAGDELLVTAMEHHSNIVPWQILCDAAGAKLVVVPMSDAGELALADVEARLSAKTKLLACTWVSNALGTVNPVREISALARAKGVPVLVDAAQALPHLPVDVATLGADFIAFSSHKVYGPSGIGALWGREEHLAAMPPWMGGGDMILSVTFEKTTWNRLPWKFEAGTPNMEGAIGMGAALSWVEGVGLSAIAAHEAELLAHAHAELRRLKGLRIVGEAREKAGVVSFTLEGVHPHDIGTIVDGQGVAIRTGHHCAEPVMRRFGLPATARASFAAYNTKDDVDALVAAIGEAQRLLG